ncbi:ankyrin repeat-containing domain protein [Xylaria longipes]|nr:ankyrin repeat-containing domain protein [Xylaria longipes]
MSGGESKGHEDVVSLLLESGANPNPKTKEGQTALHWAAASGNSKTIRLLLDWGAEPNSQDAHDFTPSRFAIDNGADETVINMLLQSDESNH